MADMTSLTVGGETYAVADETARRMIQELPAGSDTTYTLTKTGSSIKLTGSDGSETSVNDTDTTYTPVAANSDTPGLMTGADKAKLDGIAPNATANEGTITAITTTSPLAGSGDAGGVALSHETSGADAGSYGDSVAQVPRFGDAFKVPSATVDAYGHVTAIAEHTVTIPNAVATTSTAGLLDTPDKSWISEISAVLEHVVVCTEETLPDTPDAHTLYLVTEE